MSRFSTLPAPERRLLIEQVAARRDVVPVIVEKDFWVCWTLARIFATPAIAPDVVFKGGTSLFKVFGAIDRFSEDIDLSVSPSSLGVSEADLDDAPSVSQRGKRVQALAERCETHVREALQPALESAIARVLGPAPGGAPWLSFEVDPQAGTPNLWFAYPSVLPQPGGYVAKRVKEDFVAEVLALELERTFWEKATILHAEYHRPPEKAIRDRSARHYADFASLWGHRGRAASLARRDLLDDVVLHKSRFFASSWASYDTARRGSFRLVPPQHRHVALARDYAQMRSMFLSEPPSFEDILATLAQAERDLNLP